MSDTEQFLIENHPRLKLAEQKRTITFYSKLLNSNLSNSQSFYEILINVLPNKSSIEGDYDLNEILSIVKSIDGNDIKEIVYLIIDFPENIFSISKDELIKAWENVWNPPEDDAITLFFPTNNTTILITHWQMIYYS